jgi:hypothetical protein
MEPFQMPFMNSQKWRASTYDGHAPDQDSIDLLRFNGSSNNISAGEPVFASAAGTVVEAFGTSDKSPPYGSVVTIDHGGGWKTQYVHLNDVLSVQKGDDVVRGQKIGKVGQISGLAPHLHYVQLKEGNAVRINFNGIPINVHAGAKKPDGTYPKQDLVSANTPVGIKQKVGSGQSVTCAQGAGLRASVTCVNIHTQEDYTKNGPWVGAKATSSVQCAASDTTLEKSYDIS